jgi:hypothetical protein
MADGNLAPSERIIITYVAFLCSRLLDIRTEAKVSPEKHRLKLMISSCRGLISIKEGRLFLSVLDEDSDQYISNGYSLLLPSDSCALSTCRLVQGIEKLALLTARKMVGFQPEILFLSVPQSLKFHGRLNRTTTEPSVSNNQAVFD